MHKGPFRPSDFTATQWSSEQDKASFGNALLQFIDSGFRQTLFTKPFYKRLSNTFGHIAHYDQAGFWEEWFRTEADHVRFIEHLLRWPCHGDPTFTFSDVERALQHQVKARDYLFRHRTLADTALRAKELATLETLEAKYRSTKTTTPESNTADMPATIESPLVSEQLPVQASLF